MPGNLSASRATSPEGRVMDDRAKVDVKGIPRSLEALWSKPVLRAWFSRSTNLLIGTLAYNLFVIVVLQPILANLFPPLNGWEHVRSVFTGHSRYTYKDLLPYVGPVIWVVGNGLCFAMLNRNLHEAQDAVRQEEKPRTT
jgi:hypothetical protein